MPVRRNLNPTYRLHKPSGQAVVTLDGLDFYLGKHDSKSSRAEYDHLLSEWLANGRRLPAGFKRAPLTVNELIVGFVQFADGYYRKDGQPTGETENVKYALRLLRHHYGRTAAGDFGPLALKTVRQAMIDSGLSRKEINRRIRHIVRCFGWGVENELVPPTVHYGLKAVKPLAKGRSEARETAPIRPVADDVIDATLPHVSRQIAAMIKLQRLTGMRPGEVCQIRTGDIDRSTDVWVYAPASHKTAHHEKERPIYFGPRAQEVVKPWLKADPGAFLFSPRQVVEEKRAEQRAARKSPMTPSQRARKPKTRPKRTPSDRYTAMSYRVAVTRACDVAFPHPTLETVATESLTADQQHELKAWRKRHRWHPNRLRHTAATRIRRDFGLDVARAILGHSSTDVTEVYAEIDRDKAVSVMRQVG